MGNGQNPEDSNVESKTQDTRTLQQIKQQTDVSESEKQTFYGSKFPIIISPQIFDLRGELSQIRRYFHANPELKFNEINTAQNIEAYLTELGIETTTKVAKTGVVGLLKGDHDGPCIMLRADMDALPLQEMKTKENESYISKNKGIMHACGHDAHLAIMCGTAKILSSLKHLLHGSVKFVFQPGEEGGAGAKVMIDEGVLENPYVDQIYGLHVWSYDSFGTARVHTGPLMAGCVFFEINVIGKGGHGAMPQGTKDVVVAISHLTQQLHSIVSRNIDPLKSCVLTIGKIDCGYRSNVIADKGTIEGTMRWFDNDIFELMMDRVRKIICGIEASFEVEITYKQTLPYTFPPVINRNKECVDLVAKSVTQVLPNGLDDNKQDFRTMAAEDFAFFLEERPGCFFFLGCGVDGSKDKPFAHHKPNFQLDERCLTVGAQVMTTLVLERLVQWNS